MLDTNVLVSAWLWHGPPHALLQRARDGSDSLILSVELIEEFTAVIARPKFRMILERTGSLRTEVADELRRMGELVVAPPLEHPVCRDPDDDHLLALARAARADLLVTGDDDLLTLGAFDTIPVLPPAAALARLQAINP